MKVTAVIVCEDGLYHDGKKTINSLLHYNPDFNVVVLATKEMLYATRKYNLTSIVYITPPTIKEYIEKCSSDIILKLGADCLVLGRLDEIITGDFDVASARNDSDFVGNRDERHNRPDIIRDIPNHEWVNADCVAIKNRRFLDDWLEMTLAYNDNKVYSINSNGKKYAGDDQMSLNVVFKLFGYKTKILDPTRSSVVYGSSGNWSGEPMSVENHWPSWKNIYLNKDGQAIIPDKGYGLGDRVAKILHQGGGFCKEKLSFSMFNNKFAEHLKKITGFNQ